MINKTQSCLGPRQKKVPWPRDSLVTLGDSLLSLLIEQTHKECGLIVLPQQEAGIHKEAKSPLVA